MQMQSMMVMFPANVARMEMGMGMGIGVRVPGDVAKGWLPALGVARAQGGVQRRRQSSAGAGRGVLRALAQAWAQ